MTGLLITIIWAHLGFVVTLEARPRRSAIGCRQGWRRLPGTLAAGPLVWLLAISDMLRSKPRPSQHFLR